MKSLYERQLRVVGLWWLPSRPENKLSGILTFDQDQGGKLEVIGGLRDPFAVLGGGSSVELDDSDFERSGNYGRVCGAAGGKYFTLEGCFQTSASNILGGSAPGSSTEVVHVGHALRGIGFELDEPVEATRVDVRLLHFTYWIAQGGFGETGYFPGKAPEGEPSWTLTHQWVPEMTIALNNGMQLDLIEQMGTDGDRITSRAWTRDFVLRLAGDQRGIEEFLQTATYVQQLVSIGVDRASTFEAVEFRHPDLAHERPGADPIPLNAEFYAQWLNWEARNTEAIGYHDLLFTLEAAGGMDTVSRWCALAHEHRTAIGRVMVTRHRSSQMLDDKLFNRAAALEGFDRVRHNNDEQSFYKRIMRCQDLAGAPFTDTMGKPEAWAKVLKASRVDLAHHTDRIPARDSELLYWLAESAYYLFVMGMLRLAGAPDTLFERIAQNQRFAGVGRRLQQVMPTS
ncbi:MAG: hypothetical protein ACT452_02545 [Microthrixaceae bacterium]